MISSRAGTASASNPRMCVMDSVTAVTAQMRRWIGVTLAAVSLKYSSILLNIYSTCNEACTVIVVLTESESLLVSN